MQPTTTLQGIFRANIFIAIIAKLKLNLLCLCLQAVLVKDHTLATTDV